MKRNLIAMLVVAGGLTQAMFGQQYPPQNSRNPNYNGQYGNGQYAGPNDDYYDDDDVYDYDDQGVYAPAPPQAPAYAYQRPPMPGPGYFWVDGYWNFNRGRYAWVAGYWMLPPYAGGYWVRPRYVGGRFFRGFWGGGPGFNRGYYYNGRVYRGYRNGRGVQAPYRGPGQGFRHNDDRRFDNRGPRGR